MLIRSSHMVSSRGLGVSPGIRGCGLLAEHPAIKMFRIAAALLVVAALWIGLFVKPTLGGAIEWAQHGLECCPLVEEAVTDEALGRLLDEWGSMGLTDRISCLQRVAEREAARLNLPLVPEVKGATLPASIRGEYFDGKILVNENLLLSDEEGWGLARTVAHESYHCFQQEAIGDPSIVFGSVRLGEVYEDDIDDWRSEFADYKDSGEEYFDQKVESSAREYSDDSVRRIWTEAGKEGEPNIPPNV